MKFIVILSLICLSFCIRHKSHSKSKFNDDYNGTALRLLTRFLVEVNEYKKNC